MVRLSQTGELKQTLKLTSSMQQSLNMLQMSSLELRTFAAEELAKNPFLEDETSTEEVADSHTLTTNYESPYIQPMSRIDPDNDYLSNMTTERTLKDHISEQINIEINDQKEKLIAYYLLDLLQSNGYIQADIQEVADQLKCDLSLVNNILRKLQKFDPVGIFARNLQECLKIQLIEKKTNNKQLLALIENLELLAKGELKRLMKICGVELDELKNLIAQVKDLNPKPANGFLVEATIFKIPDVILTIDHDGQAKLEINPETIPRIKINQEYYLQVKSDVKTKYAKEFTKAEIISASNVVKAIQHRVKTILKVAACIVEAQIDFFTRGVMYLKPLTLNTIAEITGFNESTISRSTANKYISAPSGIYELKYFFSSKLENTKGVGSDVSSTKVKEIIKQLINAEEDNILSDDDLSQELRKFNIAIARRTVAKYRESLQIPTSSMRKKHRNLL